ncbi:hypothetical protein MFUR16E_04835 [Methylobacterium fujisawaense]|uniref:hypothetical protein n=1 Tax=Methylobacterium fujisawaense TaxID=107400 RepID=UPI002F3287B5
MAVEASEIISGLPPWAQLTYAVGALLGTGSLGLLALLKSRRDEKAKAASATEEDHEHFDPDELLAASPIVKFMADVTELSVNARIIAEGVRNISAVATLAGKRWEDGYDELRVWKAVQERFDKEMERRQRGTGTGGWGGP